MSALATPVWTASGCGGTGRELAALGGLDGVGFVTRTITLTARDGAPAPRLEESPAGWVHHLGEPNPGLGQFLALELPWLVAHGVPTVVSIAAETLDEYAELARHVGQAPGVRAVEVNLGSSLMPVRDRAQAARLVDAVRAQLPSGVPAIAKIAADQPDGVATARTVIDAGAEALVLGGVVDAAFADGRPGSLSGPAIAPIARRMVRAITGRLPGVSLIASGGVCTTDDARLLLAAGATAVQVGTALLHDPTTAARIAAEIGETP